jgi:hypothetical protein
LDEISSTELEGAADVTAQASPSLGRLARHYLATRTGPSNPASGKGMYLLRDTVKVIGSKSADLAPASFGLFFVDLTSPAGGGTGHTMRVCALLSVPTATQRDWQHWPVP